MRVIFSVSFAKWCLLLLFGSGLSHFSGWQPNLMKCQQSLCRCRCRYQIWVTFLSRHQIQGTNWNRASTPVAKCFPQTCDDEISEAYYSIMWAGKTNMEIHDLLIHWLVIILSGRGSSFPALTSIPL